MSILEKINSPEDLRALDAAELSALAGEIRGQIISSVAENGGHLASNLGMVEAEIALHRVFSCPEDSIVFDVGHQAYAHKLLTGRRDVFPTLRQSGGVSGFTNRTESEYDTVTAGHSGTALSTAVGIAEANRIAGNGAYAVAVVGDGSFTNGMAYEALNQLAGRDLKLILLLNDNAMSISRNVGGVSRYFSKVRTSRKYFSFKMGAKKFFTAIPFVGGSLVNAAAHTRDFFKRTVGAETWFELMGLDYIGPVDGNDIEKLTSVLAEAKHKGKPVVVHMMTEKGRGFAPAEEHPEAFHSTAPFNKEDGTPKNEKKHTFTDEFSDLLCKRAARDKGIVAVTAAMTEGCGLTLFRGVYPERFFDVGIAEEHAVTFSAGLSLGGLKNGGIKPVLVMYSTFSQRVFDQLWHDFCLQNEEKNDLSLVLMLSHAGLVPGDGVTHQGIYDVSLLSRLPHVSIWSPDDYAAMQRAFDTAVGSRALTVVRYPKSGENVYGVEFADCGTWKKCTVGSGEEYDLVVTYGRIAKNAVEAAQIFSRGSGKTVVVCVLERIVPLPEDDGFLALVSGADRVTFVEEGIRSGGIGEALAASGVSEKGVNIIAIENGYLRCGSTDGLMKAAGLDAASIADRL